MYLVGLHIYYKMIHGPYNIKFVISLFFFTFCLELHHLILAASLLISAREFVSAAYVKALVLCYLRSVLYFYRYFARKMSVVGPQAMLSANSTKNIQALPGVTQSLCSAAQKLVLQTVFLCCSYCLIF